MKKEILDIFRDKFDTHKSEVDFERLMAGIKKKRKPKSKRKKWILIFLLGMIMISLNVLVLYLFSNSKNTNTINTSVVEISQDDRESQSSIVLNSKDSAIHVEGKNKPDSKFLMEEEDRQTIPKRKSTEKSEDYISNQEKEFKSAVVLQDFATSFITSAPNENHSKFAKAKESSKVILSKQQSAPIEWSLSLLSKIPLTELSVPNRISNELFISVATVAKNFQEPIELWNIKLQSGLGLFNSKLVSNHEGLSELQSARLKPFMNFSSRILIERKLNNWLSLSSGIAYRSRSESIDWNGRFLTDTEGNFVKHLREVEESNTPNLVGIETEATNFLVNEWNIFKYNSYKQVNIPLILSSNISVGKMALNLYSGAEFSILNTNDGYVFNEHLIPQSLSTKGEKFKSPIHYLAGLSIKSPIGKSFELEFGAEYGRTTNEYLGIKRKIQNLQFLLGFKYKF